MTQIARDADRQAQDLALAAGRRIAVPGLFNLRDLGGYPTVGGEIPWRRLYRSDAPCQLDAEGIATLSQLGLQTIVDLRTEIEAEMAPSLLDLLRIRPTHVSILGSDLQGLPLELGAIYAHIIRTRGAAIAAAIRPLCAADAYPALVHCSAGKDRTGIVVAMVLSVLGVPDEFIAADYALSASYLDPTQTAVIGQLRENTGLGDNLTEELILSPPQLIMDVLASARTTHGSVDGYLLGHGLRETDLTALRVALAC